MKVILPMEKYPMFLSRYESAVYFSVIQAQGKEILPWLSCQMLNCHCSNDFVWRFDTIKNMSWYADAGVFFRKRYLYDCHIPGWSRSEILDMLTGALERGQYVHTKLNPRFLPDDESFQSFSRDTEALIYGYDSEEKRFFFLRFLPDRGMTECSAAFDELIKALCEKEDGKAVFDLLKFNEAFPFRLNAKELYNGIYDFLHSTRQSAPLLATDRVDRGVVCLQKFGTYLTQVGVYYEYIDRKYYTAFYDFQVAMGIRYEHLCEIGIIPKRPDTVLEAFRTTAEDFLLCCERYNRDREPSALPAILCHFDALLDRDISFSQEMLDALKLHLEGEIQG